MHQAQALTYSQFTTYLDYWLLAVDPDGADLSDIERCGRRRVSLDTTLSGMRSGSILLDPISGEIVGNELSRLEEELFAGDRAEAKERLGRDPLTGELRRTGDQRRADALVEMAKRSAAMPADAKTPRALFTLVLGNDAFSHLTQLASGQVVPPSAILPWISDADLERILFAGGADSFAADRAAWEALARPAITTSDNAATAEAWSRVGEDQLLAALEHRGGVTWRPGGTGEHPALRLMITAAESLSGRSGRSTKPQSPLRSTRPTPALCLAQERWCATPGAGRGRGLGSPPRNAR